MRERERERWMNEELLYVNVYHKVFTMTLLKEFYRNIYFILYVVFFFIIEFPSTL